jgi:hypothetical protein
VQPLKPFPPGSRSSALLVAVACCAAAATLAHASLGKRNPAIGLVLLQRDVGHDYRPNPNLTGARKLGVVGQGDSAAVRRELRRSWIGGQTAAYNGVSVPWGIVSISDVFTPSARMKLILEAWERDLVKISRGKREPLPAGAPGTGGALVRGRLLTYELLIYMWRHGRTISSVDVTGQMGKVPLGLLMKLARRQNARIGASRFG